MLLQKSELAMDEIVGIAMAVIALKYCCVSGKITHRILWLITTWMVFAQNHIA